MMKIVTRVQRDGEMKDCNTSETRVKHCKNYVGLKFLVVQTRKKKKRGILRLDDYLPTPPPPKNTNKMKASTTTATMIALVVCFVVSLSSAMWDAVDEDAAAAAREWNPASSSLSEDVLAQERSDPDGVRTTVAKSQVTSPSTTVVDQSHVTNPSAAGADQATQDLHKSIIDSYTQYAHDQAGAAAGKDDTKQIVQYRNKLRQVEESLKETGKAPGLDDVRPKDPLEKDLFKLYRANPENVRLDLTENSV